MNPDPPAIGFSLCAIYKNEAALLEKFIQNHQKFIQEWILVDTGSTDQSKEIVQAHHLPLYSFPWTQNFSQARNYSLAQATKPWIVVLDIDEQIIPEDFESLIVLMQKSKKDAYSLRQINFSNDDQDLRWQPINALPSSFQSLAQGFIPSPLIRVFRNFQGIHFRGIIHEIVGDSIREKNLSSQITSIPIYHYGWITLQKSEAEKKQKKAIYDRMIQTAWETEPSPQTAFYYLINLNNPQEKIKLAYQLTKKYPRVSQFWILLAQTALEQKFWDRALSYAEKGLTLFSQENSLKTIQARALSQSGQAEAALIIYNQLLNREPNHPVFYLEKLKTLILLNRRSEAETFLKQIPSDFPQALVQKLMALLN